MRDAIAWSHDLLGEAVQTVFRRLAVFPGGCTIDAAEAVADPDGALDAFAGIESLVDVSLLRQEEGSDGGPRFRMLETVREYGLERLELSSEAEVTRRRLADWCLSLAEEMEPRFSGGAMQPRWVVRLKEELPNVRTVVAWLLDRGEATRVLRILGATEDYWIQQQHRNAESHRWLETALAAASDAPAKDRAFAHWLLAMMNVLWGHGEDAGDHAQQALIAARASGDRYIEGTAQYAIGVAWVYRGDLEQAAAAMADAIPLIREAGNQVATLYTQADLGDKLVLLGNLDAGVPMVDEALTRLRQISSDWFVVIAIAQRGHVALRQGDLPGAARWFTESINQAQMIQQTLTVLSAVTGLAGVALALGQAERAARLLGAIEAAREALGLVQVHHPHHADRIAADTRAALEAAVHERVWSVGRTLPLEEAVAEALAVADEVVAQARC